MNIDKELVGASTGVLILGVLARDPSYGYRIIKRINDDADGLFAWQEGTVYPVLHKLEREGLVTSEWRVADTGRRRKYYVITETGRKAIAERSRQWMHFNVIVQRFAEAPSV